MMTARDLPATWHTITTDARALPLTPTQIANTIHATADNGLRGTNYDGPGGNTGPGDPTPTRALAGYTDDPHKRELPRHVRANTDTRDLVLLNRATVTYIAAVATITTICTSDPTPTTWPEALHHAHQLDQRGSIQAAVDVDLASELHPPIRQARTAIDTLQRIHDGHCAHLPDEHARMTTADTCLSHARIGDFERPRHGRLVICKTCRDLLAACGTEPLDTHRDPDVWPPIDLLREHAHMERTGKRDAYRRTRAAWITTRSGPIVEAG